jgi:hypothetical protein
LLAGVFCLFAAVGVCTDLLNLDKTDAGHLALGIIANGLIAAAFAWGSARGAKVIFALILLSFVYNVLINRFYPRTTHPLVLETLPPVIILHGVLITVFIVLGYILLSAFVGVEGKRFFAANTEIELAAGIQRDLVPPVSLTGDGFEAYGISTPSGAIGGDLLDIVPCGDASLAYVADVAGHGVKAGVLMSMVKASVRTHFAVPGIREEKVLESLNEVLYPLTDSGSYATLAFVLIEPGKPLLFSLAGHLPILHFKPRLGTVEQHAIENFPVAMFPNVSFEVSSVKADSGDLLAIVTDGLVELPNKQGKEIGFGYIEDALRSSGKSSLKQIADGIIQTSQRFGTPVDDRTLLLIRLA